MTLKGSYLKMVKDMMEEGMKLGNKMEARHTTTHTAIEWKEKDQM